MHDEMMRAVRMSRDSKVKKTKQNNGLKDDMRGHQADGSNIMIRQQVCSDVQPLIDRSGRV